MMIMADGFLVGLLAPDSSIIRWVYLILCITFVSGSGVHVHKYTYRGCYADSNDLKDKSMTMETLTLEGCAGMCQRSGFPFAGLQEGRLCYCGHTYDVLGKSVGNACNMTCGTDSSHCGGYLANDVYYTVDTSNQLSTSFVLTETPAKFRDARMACVGNNGDLVCPTDSNINSQLVAALANDSSITKVWIGLYRKDMNNTSTSYDWTDETLSNFKTSGAQYSIFWAGGETQLNPCVSLDARSGKWQSTDCNTALPFFCKQPPVVQGDDTTGSTDVESDGSSNDVGSHSKRLALFIVLPLFILCYGGSCILYCVHKIIKNCNRKKHPTMMLSPAEDAAQKNRVPGAAPPPAAREKSAIQPTPPYRPLSTSKRITVYPAPQPQPPSNALPLPGKFPMYMDTGNQTKPNGDEFPGKDPAPGDVTSRSVKIAMPETGADQSPPPKYVDRQEEKRARLLENASRESRMRREKEAEDGRPTSRPLTAPKRQPEEYPAPENHGSTTNLLGKQEKDKDPEAAAGGSGEPQSMANMSIKEILKMKMAQKADKKRPRKIIAA